MSGALLQATTCIGLQVAQAHSTTITAVDPGGDSEGYVAGSFGSIADATYSDDRTTRTILAVFYNSGDVTYRLNTTSIANDNRTFYSVLINGTEYLREDATYNSSGPGSSTQWVWAGSNPFGANPNPLIVNYVPA